MPKTSQTPEFNDINSIATWTLNSKLESIYANPCAKQLAEDPFDGLLEQDKKSFKKFIQSISAEEGIYLPWISADAKKSQWFKWIVKKNDDLFYVVAVDVTDIKNNELYLGQILDSIPDLILVKGEGSRIVWANKAFQEHYRLNGEELKEMIDAPFVSPDYTKQYIIDDKEVWDTGKPLLIECEPVIKYDGTVRKYQTLKTPVFGPNKKILYTVGISRDITEKIENEEKSVTASKMAAIGEMAGGMAHEINNPMAVIAGKSFILRRMLNREGEISKDVITNYLDTVDVHVERIAKVITTLRKLSVNDDFESFTQFDIRELIENTLMLCKTKIKEKGIVFHLEIPKGILADVRVVQLSQAILNLINNATDAIENVKDKWIKIEVRTNQEMLEILVSDSGPGVTEEIVGKIFQPFFTTKDIGKGSGLGLSFALSVAQNHHGTLMVNKGVRPSCFILQIPLKQTVND